MINFVFKKKKVFLKRKKKIFLTNSLLDFDFIRAKVPVDIKRFAEIFSRKLFLKKISLDVFITSMGQ